MRRTRLLLVVPAATALVFTGMSPALAGGGDGHGHGHDDVWAEVVSIGDEAEATDDAKSVDVEFEYKCEGEDLTAKVVLKQGDDVRYEGKSEELECDGGKQSETVTLDQESHDAVENGEAWVTVRIVDADGDTLDRERESVDVTGVGDDDDDDDKDRHADKDHHDDHDEHHDGH